MNERSKMLTIREFMPLMRTTSAVLDASPSATLCSRRRHRLTGATATPTRESALP
jgi:hypothetical protein